MSDNNPNGVDDDDEALRITIALSLGQDPNSAASNAPIDLTGPEEDDDECRVVEPMVNAKAYGRREAPSASTASGSSSIVVPAPSQMGVSSSSSLLVGLDRKKMEEERLARAARKRKADDEQVGSVGGGGEGGRPYQRAKTESAATSSTSSASASAATYATSGTTPQTKSGSSTGNSSNDELPFPYGVVKRTWCLGQSRTGDDIKIEEVLQKDKLELAVLSSFQWDEEWLLEKVDIERTKMVMIAFAKDEKQVGFSTLGPPGVVTFANTTCLQSQKQEMQNNVPRSRIRFCFPPMLAMGNMHSKLQLLKFGKYLRVVVPTGNLVPYDWGETGVMENVGQTPSVDAWNREPTN